MSVGPGLVGADDLVAIQDGSGGIFVRIPAATSPMSIGQPVEVEGTLAAPYGQLEIREVGRLTVGPVGPEPQPPATNLADVGEKTEGSLVTISGSATSVTTDNGRLTIAIGDGETSVRVLADPPAGVSRDDVARGDAVTVTGIVGQRATATGRLDGYRLWLRRATDLVVHPPVATGTATPSPLPTAPAAHRDLASALGTKGAAVEVVATVIATAGLFEIGGPTIVVDDGTAAVAVILPDGTAAPRVGTSLHLVGKVGRWQGGPTVLASQVTPIGDLQAVTPRSIAESLDGSLEWRLVRICGRIDKVTHAGSRWRADMTVDGYAVVVLGEPAAGITVSTTAVGRMAVVVGIVRRSTSDSSAFQVLPRSTLDFRLGPAPAVLGAVPAARSGGSAGPGNGSGGTGAGPATGATAIESLAAFVGQNVTVAGLVMETAGDTATIDDGTGQIRVGGPAAADAVEMLEPGDAIEVAGVVRQDEQGLIVDADPASIVALPGDDATPAASAGDLAGLLPVGTSQTAGPSQAVAASMRRAAAATPWPDALTILAILLALAVVSAAAVALSRNGGRLRRMALSVPLTRSVRLARIASWRPRRGPEERR